jgi:hypothetical protein
LKPAVVKVTFKRVPEERGGGGGAPTKIPKTEKSMLEKEEKTTHIPCRGDVAGSLAPCEV